MKTILLISVLLLSSCTGIIERHNSTSRHYVVVDVEITDVKKYDKFIALEIPILMKHDAYIAMDIRSQDQKKRYITISFPNKESVETFVESDGFQEILPLNKESSTSKIFHGSLHIHK
ncbi:MAG: DUF1330 domain-containing protein [Proteobacteria bacterium]|nr:DUF1330 domain-containing protein [Pseudomonadota bacterium]